MRISVIDSGLGAEAFVSNLKKFNHIEYDLILDKKHFPYGNKDLMFLKERVTTLVNDTKNDVVIIACNTLSSIILYYKLTFNKIVIDIIKPTVNYIKKIGIKELTILSTSNTKMIDIYRNHLDIKIQYIDVSDLILSLENNLDISLEKYFNRLKINYKNVLLGCTHLIKIKDDIRKILPYNIISQDEIFVNLYSIE